MALSDLLSVSTVFYSVVGFLFYQLIKFYFSKEYTLISKIPGPKTQFPFGNILQFIGAREDAFSKGEKILQPFMKYPLCRIWFFNSPRIPIMKAQGAEAVLSSSRLLDKAVDYKFLHQWLGTGLLTSTDKKWQQRRKMITPTFHFRILKEFSVVMSEQANVLLSLLSKFDGKDSFDIYPYLTRCTLDVICETAMGRKIHAQTKTDSDYVTAVNSMAEIVAHRSTRPWIHPETLFQLSPSGKQQRKNLKILHNFTNKVIIDRRREVKKNPKNTSADGNTEEKEFFGEKRRLAFLDMLLEGTIEGKPLTNEDVREEVDTFMFEGHDTTASGLNWILFNLGRFPEIQAKVHKELDDIFGDSGRPITDEDVKEMKFLECVIKETFRLFPPVPFFGRTLNEDVNIGGYDLPAGVTVMICCSRIHRDPEFFPDPLKFDPDRFLPDNSANRHPYAYIPFSAGPRNCIGQKFAVLEEKIITAYVLRKYKIKSRDAIDDMKLYAELILRPSKGLWVQLESRR